MLVLLSVAAAQIDAPLSVVLASGAVAAALIPLGKVASVVWRGAKRWDQRLAYIDEQMRNNGGSTLRDKVDRLTGAFEEHRDESRAHREQVNKRLDLLERVLPTTPHLED